MESTYAETHQVTLSGKYWVINKRTVSATSLNKVIAFQSQNVQCEF